MALRKATAAITKRHYPDFKAKLCHCFTDGGICSCHNCMCQCASLVLLQMHIPSLFAEDSYHQSASHYEIQTLKEFGTLCDQLLCESKAPATYDFQCYGSIPTLEFSTCIGDPQKSAMFDTVRERSFDEDSIFSLTLLHPLCLIHCASLTVPHSLYHIYCAAPMIYVPIANELCLKASSHLIDTSFGLSQCQPDLMGASIRATDI